MGEVIKVHKCVGWVEVDVDGAICSELANGNTFS